MLYRPHRGDRISQKAIKVKLDEEWYNWKKKIKEKIAETDDPKEKAKLKDKLAKMQKIEEMAKAKMKEKVKAEKKKK